MYLEVGDPDEIGGALMGIGLVKHETGDLADAMQYYEQSAQQLRKTETTMNLIAVINNMGNIYLQSGNYPKAIEKYQEALRLNRTSLNDKEQIGSSFVHLGRVYYMMERGTQARQYFMQALEVYKEIDNHYLINQINESLALLHFDNKEYDRARALYKKILAFYEANSFERDVPIALSNIGATYLQQQQFGKALTWLMRAKTAFEEVGMDHGRADLLRNIGETHFLLGETAQARINALASYNMAVKSDLLEQQKQAANLLYKIDSARGDFRASLEWHKKYKTYADSLINEDKARKIGELEARFEFDKEIEAREKAEAQAEARRARIRWVAGGIGAGLLAISLLLFAGFRLKQKSNQELKAKNAEITQQSEEIRLQNETIIEKNEKLDAALAELRELSRFKESMTGMVVHDLKNPLSSILALADAPDLEARRDPLRAAARQMHTLTLNMLDVQKLESADAQLDLKPVSARAAAAAALEQVAYLAAEKNLRLANDVPPALGLLADDTYLVRVLVNLLNNAIKFSPYGGTISLTGNENQGRVALAVTDQGPGVPPEKLDAVFEKFSKLNDKTGRNKQGTGLGLAFCKLAAEAHGGSIRAENAPEGGARFRLDLPAAVLSESAAALATNESPPPAAPLPLTAEDRKTLAPVAARMREIDIYEVSSLVEALEATGQDASAAVRAWRQRAEAAVYALDEDALARLLNEADAPA